MATSPTRTSKASISKIESELKKLKQEASDQNVIADQIVEQSYREQLDDETRKEIATLITKIYFAILAVVIVGIPLYNLLAFEVTGGGDYRFDLLDVLQGYQALVGTLVGFVIAYYFKEKNR